MITYSLLNVDLALALLISTLQANEIFSFVFRHSNFRIETSSLFNYYAKIRTINFYLASIYFCVS